MNIIKVENVMIFPEKMEFLVNRGGRTRVFAVYQGRVMVRIEGFDNYYLCLKDGEVYSKRGDKFQALKKEIKGGQVYYRLFLNGCPERVSLFRIFQKNLKEIERFLSEKKSFPDIKNMGVTHLES